MVCPCLQWLLMTVCINLYRNLGVNGNYSPENLRSCTLLNRDDFDFVATSGLWSWWDLRRRFERHLMALIETKLFTALSLAFRFLSVWEKFRVYRQDLFYILMDVKPKQCSTTTNHKELSMNQIYHYIQIIICIHSLYTITIFSRKHLCTYMLFLMKMFFRFFNITISMVNKMLRIIP